MKHFIDWAALASTAATMVGWLPNIAAGLAIVWYLIRLYEWIQSKRS